MGTASTWFRQRREDQVRLLLAGQRLELAAHQLDHGRDPKHPGLALVADMTAANRAMKCVDQSCVCEAHTAR